MSGIAALRQLLKRGRYDNDAMYDILMKQQQKGYTNLNKAEKAQYDQLYNIFGRDAMETMEGRLFHALGGKYPELDDMVKGGKYLDDDVLTNMFNRKIDSVIDDFAARADDLKGAKNPDEEAISLLEELMEYDLPELIQDRKSINDISGGLFADDMMTVDPEGRLDVLVDAVDDMYKNAYSGVDVPYMEASVVDELGAAMSPEYLAHNLRGAKAHVNTLPKAQKAHKKKSGTVEDTDFWDEDLGGDRGVQDKNPSDIRFDATYGNVAKEGKYTPVDLPVEGTMDPSNQIQWDPNPRQPGDFSEIDAAGQKLKDQLEAVEARRRTGARSEGFFPEDHKKFDAEADAITAEIEAEIARLKKKKTGGIVKRAGGGIMSGPLYNRDF